MTSTNDEEVNQDHPVFDPVAVSDAAEALFRRDRDDDLRTDGGTSTSDSGRVIHEKIPERFAGEPLTEEDMPPCTSMMGHQLEPVNDEAHGAKTRMVCLHCGESRLVMPGDLDRYPESFEYPPWCELDAHGDGLRTDGGRSVDVRERTRVGHCRHDEIDFYIGRGDGGDAHLLNTDPPNRGCLGNPFPVDEHGRVQCVERFRVEFEALIESDPEFRQFIGGLSGRVLGCWCQRLDEDGPMCHGEIIAEWADRINHSQDTGIDR